MLTSRPAASSEAVRDANRRLVLNLVRRRQPISRADLARVSGLQRSTISLIVEELVEERWVLEGPTGRLPRGRRPTFLRLNDERVIIGVDIRPIQTTIAVANANGEFFSRQVMETPSTPQAAIKSILGRVQPLIEGGKRSNIEGIGLSLPGRVDRDSGRLIFAPNLGWTDVDLGTPIAKATGFDVESENEANACLLAAVWFDADARRNLVVVTVSEGIGTGILMNGQLVRGHHGMAGEFGHVTLDPKGPQCRCGNHGCWEVFGSNRAASRYYHDATARVEGLSFSDILSLAEQGDAKAAAALDKMAHGLGRGMPMVVKVLAPERILVFGEVTRAWPRFGPVVEAEVRAQMLPGAKAPAIVPAHQDGMARLRGPIALVLEKHFGAPDEVLA